MEHIEETKEEQRKIKPYWVQPEKEKNICDNIWQEFTRYRNNRDRKFGYFRHRNLNEYISDSNARFNNYKEKPAWKEEWQANISDITTHSKLMAIIAQIVANRFKPEFYASMSNDLFSKYKAHIYTDLYEFTDRDHRNGDIDDLFMTLKATREGTSIGFEGWKKGANFEGVDARIVPVLDFYPEDVSKFDMREQKKAIWRTVALKWRADQAFKGWHHYNKVISGEEMTSEDKEFFNISEEIEGEKVEILRFFDTVNDQYHVVVNGILITKPGSKLSTRFKHKRLPFWKTVYEPFDDCFFYGRSLPDLMRDNQDAIDYLFNTIFDREMISLLRPIFTSGINELTDDYLYPGRTIQVNDVQQVKEMDISPPDQVSFKVLQELQNRQHFVSVGSTLQGAATGRKTAHEVERAVEAAKKLISLFSVMLQDGLKQKAELRVSTLLQYMTKQKKIEPIVLHSTKLFSGKTGTKILEIVPKDKLAPKNTFGYSQKLATRAALSGDELTEIIQITPKELQNFKWGVWVRVPSSVEMSPSLEKAYSRDFSQFALNRPDLYDQETVARKYADAMNQDPEEVVRSTELPPRPEAPGGGGGKGYTPELPKPKTLTSIVEKGVKE